MRTAGARSQTTSELDDGTAGRSRASATAAIRARANCRTAARMREAPSANPGAPADGSPFPNTDPALFANAGETMAETYTRTHGVPKPERRHHVRRRVDRSERTREGCELRVQLCRAVDAGAGGSQAA